MKDSYIAFVLVVMFLVTGIGMYNIGTAESTKFHTYQTYWYLKSDGLLAEDMLSKLSDGFGQCPGYIYLDEDEIFEYHIHVEGEKAVLRSGKVAHSLETLYDLNVPCNLPVRPNK